jgi:hypothetical protein
LRRIGIRYESVKIQLDGRRGLDVKRPHNMLERGVMVIR